MTERRTIYVGRDDMWERFVAACKEAGKSPSKSIREHMARVVKRAEVKK